jgi:hypothetical protein
LRQDRLKKLATRIDALAAKDQQLVEQTQNIAVLRREAAVRLHALCAEFVKLVNGLLLGPPIELDPPAFWPDSFQEGAPNLFQINVRGRVLQIEFASTDQILSTEDFRVPYTIEGVIRSFNQELLDQNVIEEQLLFFCIAKEGNHWRFFDSRTYRTGVLDLDYMVSVMEEVV